ncbi:MAG: L-methionine sulfoximine/L-methionine sulfone acetyltransferase [Steroidobacteraceae bacterium]|nr:L-methionine sulfoximine/L-methionine sulfone acetyltransferase [Steroidobacteraceae bacterium]
MEVRACVTADLPAVQAIYAHHVLHGTGTFEEVPPTLAEMTARHEHIVADGRFPFLVAIDGGRVIGYAYATEFRARSAYRHTCESSVYIAPDALRRGVGHALMHAVIDQCRAHGFREMLAVIGDSQNHASIGLHNALGFAHAGTFHDVGYKFGRWLDVVLMQLSLRSGEA